MEIQKLDEFGLRGIKVSEANLLERFPARRANHIGEGHSVQDLIVTLRVASKRVSFVNSAIPSIRVEAKRNPLL